MVRGPQKQCTQVSDLQIPKYKYTNTALVKVADRHDMCYFLKGNGKRTSETMFLGVWQVKYSNTNTQVPKYINTALIKVADRHDMCYIFEKVMVRGPQKQGSWMNEVQIQKYKWKYTNTNTQIQLRSKLQICLIWYIFKRVIRRRLTSFRMLSLNPHCLLSLFSMYSFLSWAQFTVV